MQGFLKNSKIVSGATLAVVFLFLFGCEVGSSTKAKTPYRAPAGVNSGVASSATTAEVNSDLTVAVTVKDKSGYGIPNIVPTVTAVRNSTGLSTGVSSGGCGRTDTKGVTNCTIKAQLDGAYTVKLLSPVALSSSSTVTFVQFARSLAFVVQPSTTAVSLIDLATITDSAGNVTGQPQVKVLDRAGNAMKGAPAVKLFITANTTAKLNGVVSTALAPASATPDATTGIAAFSGLDIDLAATYTFSAFVTDTTTGVITGTSAAFTVTPGNAVGLKFFTNPSSTAATNVAFAQQPIVKLIDSAGNAVTGANPISPFTNSSACPVTLSLFNPETGDTLLGSAISKTMVGGVADFVGQNLRVKRTGTTTTAKSDYQLQASFSGAASCTVLNTLPYLSTPFEITLTGLPFQLQLVQPPGTAALNETWANQPIVGVLDVAGNLVTDDQSSSVFMNNTTTSSGTLVGSTTIQVVNGLAQFSGLVIRSTSAAHAKSYTYTFTGVSSTGLVLTPVTGVTQTITSFGLVPAKLMFRTQPASVAVQEQMGSVEAKVVDSNGFFCFNDNVTKVRFSYDPTTFGDTGEMTQNGVTIANLTAQIQAVNGIATVNGLAFTTQGAKIIQATSTLPVALTSADSNIFAINAHSNTADHIEFLHSVAAPFPSGAQPSPWTTQPQVAVKDAFGNTMTNDNATKVTISCIQSSPCDLRGNLQVTVVNGVAAFQGLRMNAAATGILLSATASPALPITTAAQAPNTFTQP